MLSNAKIITTALLLAYRALAAPVSSISHDHIHSVIDALKTQLRSIPVSEASAVLDSIEAAVGGESGLDSEHVAMLDQRLKTVMVDRALDSESVAAATIEYLDANGVFDRSEQEEVNSRVSSLTTDMIGDVLAEGDREAKRDCPHKGQMCGGCFVM